MLCSIILCVAVQSSGIIIIYYVAYKHLTCDKVLHCTCVYTVLYSCDIVCMGTHQQLSCLSRSAEEHLPTQNAYHNIARYFGGSVLLEKGRKLQLADIMAVTSS